MSKKLFGCPIKPATLAKWSLRLGVRGAAQGPQKLWGKWCKILHSGHILAHKSWLQLVSFFYWNFCLTSHKAPRSSGLKGAKICNLAISWHINQLFWTCYSIRPGHKLPHVWEMEIDKIRLITGNGIGIRFRSNINNADDRLFEEFYIYSHFKG